MSGRISYPAEPVIGDRLVIESQIYELIKIHDSVRPNRTITFLDWRTHCPTCGAEFITSTTTAGNMPTRRCRAHRAAGRQVTRGPRRKLSIRIVAPGAAK